MNFEVPENSKFSEPPTALYNVWEVFQNVNFEVPENSKFSEPPTAFNKGENFPILNLVENNNVAEQSCDCFHQPSNFYELSIKFLLEFNMKFDKPFVEGIYNFIPEEMLEEQRKSCRFCSYRFYKLKLELAEYEAQIRGGSAREYLDLSINLYKTELKDKCKEKGCLLSKLNFEKKVILSFNEND
ncbi:MAG: hypothetical protein Q7S33_04640 [Nanoarchaeota archaeon]|nr:hypothetical protein [Nanoarchaeota archaeon]